MRRAHELVISVVPRPEIPAPLADSWRLSMALGISPDQHSPCHLHDPSKVLQLRREHRLQRVKPALQDLMADDSSSAGTCWYSQTPAAKSCGGWAAGRCCGGRTGWSSRRGGLVR